MATDDGSGPGRQRRPWVGDLVLGGVPGLLAGAVLAVNIVIFSGVDRGYEATPAEVFAASPVAGAAAVVALLAGPVLGVSAVRRLRRALRGR